MGVTVGVGGASSGTPPSVAHMVRSSSLIGTAGEVSETIFQFDWNRDLVLVLGSEERGLSPSIKKRCHQLVSIPSCGHVEALNVSVAAGVTLSEIVRQRSSAKGT